MTHPTRQALEDAMANAQRGHRITEWEDVASALGYAARGYIEHVEAKRAEWEDGREDPLWQEVLAARAKAHLKHGENSIESTDYWDPAFLAILMEEVGELAHVLTYDSVRYDPATGMERTELEQATRRRTRMREELIDILSVCGAWVSSIDEEIERNRHEALQIGMR